MVRLITDSLEAFSFAVQRHALLLLNERTVQKLRQIQALLKEGKLSVEDAQKQCQIVRRVYKWNRNVLLKAKIGA